MKKGENPYTVLDLFAGAGGMSLGFTQAGFSVIGGVEIWSPAARTYEKNHRSSRLIEGDIRSLDVQDAIYELHKEKNVDIIIGGFPCQGFSIAGNRDPLDSRSQLYREYLKIVKMIKPLMFVMENVKGLVSMRVIPPDLPQKEIEFLKDTLKKIQRYKDLKRYCAQRELIDDEEKEYTGLKEIYPDLKQDVESVLVPLLPLIQSEIESLGYTPTYKVLNATLYGSAQSRQRIFIAAIRNDLQGTYSFPEPLITNPRTVKEAIGDLENIGEGEIANHEFTEHATAFVKRLAKVKPGETLYKRYSDAWWRLVPDQPSRTVKENHGAVFIHYNQDRVITPREMARLQDFPDDFVFLGPKSTVLKQIGNAVPVRLSKAIAISIKECLSTATVTPFTEQLKIIEE
ncbi:MAG TPA: DNA cytosine methyltransferase [Candidatus Lokiarchaeia archaeon]|nr:DNA cytosine methyltransferase [Candidatus Lokiarchaeia archaeon]